MRGFAYWLATSALVAALLFYALSRRERDDAPPPPPPLSPAESQVLAQAAPFDPAKVVKVTVVGDSGSAFSVSDTGVWLTARRVVGGCDKVAILVGAGDGVVAKVSGDPKGEVAVLTTPGGAPALPLSPGAPPGRSPAYAGGFPHGEPGEVAMRLVGGRNEIRHFRDEPPIPVLVWAEIGRTDGLKGDLGGLSGAPALDSTGRVVGVTLEEAPRRGRVTTTTTAAITQAMADAKVTPSAGATGVAISPDNYGLAADDLRRAFRVAPVACVK